MKVIGIGLNKTGTKTLRRHLVALGFKHQSYSLDRFNEYRAGAFDKLFAVMDEYDSFEDWPWPLMYREIDEHYEDALFVLTTRASPERWYKSLCKMAIRMGPFNDFEKHIYGYNMPQGRKKEHIDYYNKFNEEVREYFKDRPGKLLEICWENGDSGSKLSQFVGKPQVELQKVHANQSIPVYDGDNLLRAHVNRIFFQIKWYGFILPYRKYYRKLRGIYRTYINPIKQPKS
ncbi:MAG: sulfotransferase [Bacteroidota bacterium]